MRARLTGPPLLVLATALLGCARTPPTRTQEPGKPGRAPSSAEAEATEGPDVTLGLDAGEAGPPETSVAPEESAVPEPPPGPPGRLVVHARGDVGVSVHRKGRKAAEGKALIPIELSPAVYTVKVHPPGLPDAELGKVTVFSKKTTDFEVAGYGELWVHTSEPGRRVELAGVDGEKVAEGKTCDFWLVPAGTFAVRTADARLKEVVVESGKMTSVAVGK